MIGLMIAALCAQDVPLPPRTQEELPEQAAGLRQDPGDHSWTELFLAAAESSAAGLRAYPQLRSEDLAPIAARAWKGAAGNEERVAFLEAIGAFPRGVADDRGSGIGEPLRPSEPSHQEAE